MFTILAASYVVASAQAPALIARHGRRLLAAGALVLAAGHGLLLGAVADIGVGGSVAAAGARAAARSAPGWAC